MFCDGQCVKKKKNGDIINRCGLYATVTVQDAMSDEVKTVDRCVLYGIMDLAQTAVQSIDKLHSATNSRRNVESDIGKDIVSTVATGFLGMIHSFTEDEGAKEKLQELRYVTL